MGANLGFGFGLSGSKFGFEFGLSESGGSKDPDFFFWLRVAAMVKEVKFLGLFLELFLGSRKYSS